MIVTQRLKLIPFDDALFQALFEKDMYLLGQLLDVRTPKKWTTFEDSEDALPFYYAAYAQNGSNWGSYFIVHTEDRFLLGTCGYKGAPNTEGGVEIGYEIHEDYRLKGLATEVATGLIEYAFLTPQVKLIRAHTLLIDNPSASVLKKLGFSLVGLFNDPDDGDIWRWEKRKVG